MRGTGNTQGIFVPSSQFCCEFKTDLKNEVYLKKTIDNIF